VDWSKKWRGYSVGRNLLCSICEDEVGGNALCSVYLRYKEAVLTVEIRVKNRAGTLAKVL
jgi:hypothetical protein